MGRKQTGRSGAKRPVGEKGAFTRMMEGHKAIGTEPQTVMIDEPRPY
jgi:hypothetical protein